MSFLAITRSLVSMENPKEAQFDAMRTALLAYFNGANLTEANLASGGMVYTSLAKAADDTTLGWTGSAALIQFISGTPTFQIENASGDIVFSNKASTIEVESLRFASTGKTTIGTGGLFKPNQGQGLLTYDAQWLLSTYRKPRLEYVDGNIVRSGENSPTDSQSLLLLRDRLGSVVDRTMSLAATANGYDAGHTGAAVSGLEDGLTRTANRWYYIYGVLVQYGTDANGSNCILVASVTPPVQASCATLDTEYGSGKWVYLGVIRNGYNDGVTTNVVIPFSYDGYGHLRFTTAPDSGRGYGIRLAASSSSSDLTYDVAFGVGATDLPVVATHGTFVGYRSANAFILDYVNISSGEIQAQGTCCADTDTTSSVVAAVFLEVPFISGYRVVVRVGSSSTTNRIMLAGLVDHYA